MAPVNGFSLVQGLDLGIFPGKLAPADFLDHLCVVGREGEVSQICEIWGDKQAVQSDIIHVISTDTVSETENFLI